VQRHASIVAGSHAAGITRREWLRPG